MQNKPHSINVPTDNPITAYKAFAILSNSTIGPLHTDPVIVTPDGTGFLSKLTGAYYQRTIKVIDLSYNNSSLWLNAERPVDDCLYYGWHAYCSLNEQLKKDVYHATNSGKNVIVWQVQLAGTCYYNLNSRHKDSLIAATKMRLYRPIKVHPVANLCKDIDHWDSLLRPCPRDSETSIPSCIKRYL